MDGFRRFYGDEIINLKELMEANRKGFIKLEYYGIKKVTENDLEEYGIEIVKKEYINNCFFREANNISNIVSDEKKLEEIVEVLKRNKVTPIGLEDIIDDLLKIAD